MAAIIDEELDHAFSVAFRPLPATPVPSSLSPPPLRGGEAERKVKKTERSRRAASPAAANPDKREQAFSSLDEMDDELEVRVFDSVVSLPSNLVAAEESCRPSRVAQGVPEAARDDLVYVEEDEIEIDVEPLFEPDEPSEEPLIEFEDAIVRLDPEVDRLLNGVRTLLEFDIVDKALRIASKALEKAPNDPQVRELYKLALYRAGRIGQRDSSGGLAAKGSRARSAGRGGEDHE
jgi:hypothetical protein